MSLILRPTYSNQALGFQDALREPLFLFFEIFALTLCLQSGMFISFFKLKVNKWCKF